MMPISEPKPSFHGYLHLQPFLSFRFPTYVFSLSMLSNPQAIESRGSITDNSTSHISPLFKTLSHFAVLEDSNKPEPFDIADDAPGPEDGELEGEIDELNLLGFTAF